MASFDIAYNKYIKPNEGGYSNVEQDKGGETYGGIARNYHPGWSGWTYIDFIKRSKGQPIKRGTMFPDIQYQVDQFYQDWWNALRYNEIKNQDVANLLFDFNVNSASTAIKTIQRLVGVPADGAIGPMTIAAINSADQVKLHNDLLAERKKLYESIVKRDPSQEVFWQGWMNRLSTFPTLIGPASTWTMIGIAAIALAVGYYFYSQPKSLT